MAILTVTTKLLNQTLDGPRIIDMGSTKTCQCFVIPRDSSIADIVKSHDALKSYAYYMLLGKINGKNAVYVGQTNDFTNRVIDHKVKKEFWDTALVFVSKAHAIYQSEVSFLEYLGWKSVTDAKNYQVENSKPILEPSVPQSTKDDMELFFEEIQFIARFFGCEAFDTPKKLVSLPMNLYHIKSDTKHVDASLEIVGSKYILHAGSLISPDTAPSIQPYAQKSRTAIIAKQVKKINPTRWEVQSNIEFDSPSAASVFVQGRSSNGWADWKNNQGQTLGEATNHTPGVVTPKKK